jgi:succinoglycan biosynthesis transport protein ExoP
MEPDITRSDTASTQPGAWAAEDAEQIELSQIFKSLWQRKILIMSCTLGMAVLLFVMVSQITPLYGSRASLILDPRSVQILASDNVVSDLTVNNPVMDTEVALLWSNVLLAQVVQAIGPDELALIDPALQEPGIVSMITGEMRSALEVLLPADDTPPVIVQSDADQRQMRRLVGALRRALTIRREGQSYMISVTAETPSPLLSQAIANTVVETYIQDQVDMRNKAISDATSFLADRVQSMRLSVQDAEQKIENYRSQQINAAGASEETLSRQILELSTQLALGKAELAQTESRYTRILSVIETEGIQAGAELLTSPYVLSLRQQISDLNRREAELATRFSEDHPDRVSALAELTQLRAELAAEVRQILANLENDLAVAGARVASITDSVAEMERRARAISRTNVELRQLEREADALRANYENMLNRLSETRSSQQLSRADARQVEIAMPSGSPSSPRVMLFTFFGATLGFALGLLLTFYLAVTRTGFMTAAEIESETGIAVGAVLLRTRMKSRQALVNLIANAPFDPFAERLRQLWTVLRLQYGRQSGCTCVQLTSSVPSESKTSTALALAYLEARTGRRCLILDFDLRKSALARELQYDAPHDLADVLLGNCAPLDAINPVFDLGFDLLTVKKSIPALTDGMDPARLSALLEDLRPHYYLILVDTAPVLLVAESLRLAPLVDTVLLLVRQGKTRRKAVRQSVTKLQSVGSAPISIAMSYTDPASESETYGAYTNYQYGG